MAQHTSNRQAHLWMCGYCGLLQRLPAAFETGRVVCQRCHSTLHRASRQGRRSALALTLAALALYWPANAFPILKMSYLGRATENTIFTGVVELYNSGLWGLAALVFAVSILVPLTKLLIMLALLWNASFRPLFNPYWSTRLHRFIEIIGPWSMLDVLLVSILVALVKLNDIATVKPGIGILAFAAVVVLTTLASFQFDSKWLWEHQQSRWAEHDSNNQ